MDQHLRVGGVEHVFAAGDTAAALAEPGHVVMQSYQRAVPVAQTARPTEPDQSRRVASN